MAFSYRFKRQSYQLYNGGRHFFSSQWAGGFVLLFFVVVAMVLANLPATHDFYHNVLRTNIGVSIGTLSFELDIEKFVNDGLMMIFFFVVGLEIKREIQYGQLSTFKQAVMPIAGAIGGMLVPALIYVLFNNGTEYSAGWGIPMATDIAFAIAIMSMMGNKVPVSLKIFLTALAVADDFGAIIVIAIFYGSAVHVWFLLGAAVMLLLAYLLNRFKVSSSIPYIIISIVLWFLFYYSGIHATMAGVLLAMVIPSKPKYSKKYFNYKVKYFIENFKYNDRDTPGGLPNDAQHEDLLKIASISTNSLSLSQRFEHLLSPIVTFVIMPIFALVNAGVYIQSVADLNVFASTQGLGIMLGLWIGKPLGITLMSWLFIKLGIGQMPKNATWPVFIAVACLGGIGFTMSIFMDTLAFASQPHLVDTGKIAVLIGSAIATVTGFVAINATTKLRKPRAKKRSSVIE